MTYFALIITHTFAHVVAMTYFALINVEFFTLPRWHDFINIAQK